MQWIKAWTLVSDSDSAVLGGPMAITIIIIFNIYWALICSRYGGGNITVTIGSIHWGLTKWWTRGLSCLCVLFYVTLRQCHWGICAGQNSGPQRCPHSHPCEYLPYKEEVTLKTYLKILRWGGNPGLSRWALCNHNCPYKWRKETRGAFHWQKGRYAVDLYIRFEDCVRKEDAVLHYQCLPRMWEGRMVYMSWLLTIVKET